MLIFRRKSGTEVETISLDGDEDIETEKKRKGETASKVVVRRKSGTEMETISLDEEPTDTDDVKTAPLEDKGSSQNSAGKVNHKSLVAKYYSR